MTDRPSPQATDHDTLPATGDLVADGLLLAHAMLAAHDGPVEALVVEDALVRMGILDSGAVLDELERVGTITRSGLNVESALPAPALAPELAADVHSALAESLLEFAIDVVEVASSVAGLFIDAGQPGRAVLLLLETAETHEAASDHQLAVEAYGTAAGIDPDVRRRLHALSHRADIAAGVDHDDVAAFWVEYAEACRLAGDSEGEARARYHLYWYGGDDAQDQLAAAAAIGTGSCGWATRAAALIRIQAADFAGSLEFDRVALRLARSSGDRQLESAALLGVAVSYSTVGDLDAAINAQRRSVAIAIASRYHRVAVTGRLNLISMLEEQLRVDESVAESRALVAYVEEHGLSSWRQVVTVELARSFVVAGRVTEAARTIQGAGVSPDAGSIAGTYVAAITARLLLDAGVGAGVEVAIAAAEEGAERFGTVEFGLMARHARARLLAANGQLEDTLSMFGDFSRLGYPKFIADVAVWLARNAAWESSDAAFRVLDTLRPLFADDDARSSVLVRREIAATIAMRDGDDAAHGELEAVERAWRASGRALDAAHVAATLGALHHAAGSNEAAGEALLRAQSQFMEMGALARIEPVAARLTSLVTGDDDQGPALDESQLLEGLGDRERRELGALAVTRSFEAGRLFFSPQDENGTVYVLRSGRVRLYCMTEDGKRLTVALLDPGAVFGENAVLGRATAGLHAEADEPVVADVIPAQRMRELIQRVPRIGLNLLGLVGERLHASHELTEQVAFWTVNQRIVRQLLDLDARYGHPTMQGGRLINRVFTHSDIAEMVNARRETVGEFLKQLRNQGLIEVRKRRIVITDVPALASLLDQ